LLRPQNRKITFNHFKMFEKQFDYYINNKDAKMNIAYQNFHSKLYREIDETPVEFLPALFQIVNAFRESVMLKSAEDSFKQGWKEALSNDIRPVSELWDEIDG